MNNKYTICLIVIFIASITKSVNASTGYLVNQTSNPIIYMNLTAVSSEEREEGYQSFCQSLYPSQTAAYCVEELINTIGKADSDNNPVAAIIDLIGIAILAALTDFIEDDTISNMGPVTLAAGETSASRNTLAVEPLQFLLTGDGGNSFTLVTNTNGNNYGVVFTYTGPTITVTGGDLGGDSVGVLLNGSATDAMNWITHPSDYGL